MDKLNNLLLRFQPDFSAFALTVAFANNKLQFYQYLKDHSFRGVSSFFNDRIIYL